MNWSTLFMTTIRTPDQAAEFVKGTDVERGVLWMGIFAVSALGAVITGLTVMSIPLPDGWPDLFALPFAHFAVSVVGMMMFAYALTWAGKGLGGQGTFDDLLKLVIWLQAVRVGLQVIGLVLLIAIPVLGAFYGLATGLLALWILVQFIKSGHEFSGFGAAIVVLIATIVGLIVGLSLLLSLVGVGAVGVSPNV